MFSKYLNKKQFKKLENWMQTYKPSSLFSSILTRHVSSRHLAESLQYFITFSAKDAWNQTVAISASSM